MKTRILTFVLLATVLVACSTPDPALFGASKPVSGPRSLAKCVKAMEHIKVGSTRAELLKIFTEAGGISSRTFGRFVYRENYYISIQAEFDMFPSNEDKYHEHPLDRIIKISHPVLDSTVVLD